MGKTGRSTLPEVRAKIAATLRARYEAEKGPRCFVNKDECWIWLWATRAGYPSPGQREGMYQRARGVYPRKHDLHHSCGEKLCVNPAHQVPLPKPSHVELHRHLKAARWLKLPVVDRIALSQALWDVEPVEATVEAMTGTTSETR